jgi:hypothetical protein
MRKMIQLGTKWTLEIEPAPTAINQVIGFVTEAHSAITLPAVFEPDGRVVAFRYSDLKRANFQVPAYVLKRLSSMMRQHARKHLKS